MIPKILYVSQRPYYPLRFAHGGQKSTHDLLVATQKILKYECMAMFYTKEDYLNEYLPKQTHWDSLGIKEIHSRAGITEIECDYPVRAISSNIDSFWRSFNDVCDAFSPNIILTGQRGAYEIVSYACNKKIATIWSIDTSPGQGVYEVSDLIKGSDLGARVICCSEYVRARISALTYNKVNPFVVYPLINCQNYQVFDRAPTYVSVINPMPAKGGELLEEIIKELKEIQFQFVIGWELDPKEDYWNQFYKRMKMYKNVHVVSRTPDIRTVFSKTKLLLVPSQWDEAFGRIVGEAQCSGIPSLVSATGGLPEVLETGGETVSNYNEAGAWIKAIRNMLAKPEYFHQLEINALECAKRNRFSMDVSLTAFDNVVKSVI